MCTGCGSNLFVGRNYVGDDSVTNHVIGVQMDEGQVFDASENALDTKQAASAIWNVNLGGVACDNDLGSEADSSEEHLHLLWSGVLCFVKNDETVV